jgi:hypothetical protein
MRWQIIKRSMLQGMAIILILGLLAPLILQLEEIAQDIIAHRPISIMAEYEPLVFIFGYILGALMLYTLPTLLISLLLGVSSGRRVLMLLSPWMGIVAGLLVSGWGVLNYFRIIVGDIDYGGKTDSSHDYIALSLFTIYFVLAFIWSNKRLWRFATDE